jgi:hypothetical protein
VSTRVLVSRPIPALLAPLCASLTALALAAPGVAAAHESWKEQIDPGNSLNAVSCVPQSTDCVVSDSKGSALYSTDVSANGAATWNAWTGPAPTEPSEAVACPATSLCTIAAGHAEQLGTGGRVYYATSLGGAWKEAFEPSYGADAISCASTTLCVSALKGGFIRESTKPASEEWFSVELGLSTITAVDCLSSSFCVAGDSEGHVYVADTEAMVEGGTRLPSERGWTATEVDAFLPLHGIACDSTTFCVAVDGEGHVLDLQINGSGEATVSKEDIDAANDLTGVTCVTMTSTCVAVDGQGNVFMSQDGGRQWGKEYAFGKDLTGVSCASRSLCVVTDTEGEVTAIAPKSAGVQWLEVRPIGNGEITQVPAGEIECRPHAEPGKCVLELPPEGTKIVLRETPVSGWKFVKWWGIVCENGGQTGETCEFKMPKGEVEVSAEFEAIKLYPVSVFVDGEGTVTGSGVTSVGAGKIECGPSGGPICATEVQSNMQLTAESEPGYVFAGWVGCRNEQGASHDRCAFEPTGATELIAVFLPEVKNATNGTNGSQGEKGLPGVTGPTGLQGPVGEEGPAGKVELVTCTKVKGKQHCKAKLVSGTVSFTSAGLAVQATLSRRGKVYAAGTARAAHGRMSLRLLPVRRLSPGKYMLTLISGTGRNEMISTRAFFLD